MTCENAALGYDGRIVVSGLDFTIAQGDYLCIVGENGSGKSTVVKGLLRLLKPMRGTITYDRALENKKGLNIGCLSQAQAAKKDFPAGVREIVMSGFLGRVGLRPFYTRPEKLSAAKTMERLELAGLKDRCFRELSGGQQRRVLLARALCAINTASRNCMLILDEPMAGLDSKAQSSLYALLQGLNRELSLTIVMVSHDLDAVKKYATKLIHLKAGRICSKL
jgi:zinc transport system ATP-binding protein